MKDIFHVRTVLGMDPGEVRKAAQQMPLQDPSTKVTGLLLCVRNWNRVLLTLCILDVRAVQD